MVEPFGDPEGDVLVVGWGGTYGSIHSAVKRARAEGLKVSQIHLRHLNPFPRNLEALLRSRKWVTAALVSLAGLLIAFFAPDAVSDSKIDEVAQRIAGLTPDALIAPWVGVPPLKWSTNWGSFAPSIGGSGDGWEAREA